MFHLQSIDMALTVCFLSRMQAQVVDLNGKIESVNRERKYHQVIEAEYPS